MKFSQHDIDISSNTIKDYKALINRIVKDKSTEVFSETFMNNFNIQSDSKVAIIDGQLFSPKHFGFNSHVPIMNNYIFFFVVPSHLKSN